MGKEFIRQIMVLGEVPSLGPVVLFDDMEGLFKWVAGGTAGDRVVEKDGTEAYNGSNSTRMVSKATGAAEDNLISVERSVYQRPGNRYRMEMLHRSTGDADTKLLEFRSFISDGVDTDYIAIRYDAINHKWQYLNSAGAFADVPGGAQNLQPAAWHRVLLEWDFYSKKYIRMISDGLEVDMSAIGFHASAGVGTVYQEIKIEGTAGASAPAEVNLDDVLILEI